MNPESGAVILRRTESLCPECLARIPAQIEIQGDDAVLAKTCPEHGEFRTVVWRGRPRLVDWSRPKIPSRPTRPATRVDRGCPFDCGLCPEHGQHTCTALLEITERCDLGCPVCFAESGSSGLPDPNLETVAMWFDRVMEASGPCNIQISGGEPTMRPDLEAIVAMGRERGFGLLQLNTNGLRLAADSDLAGRLREAGLDSIFLQFDGQDEGVQRRIRGRDLRTEKAKAVENAIRAGLGVVLVPTVVQGLNDGLLWDMIRFALEAGEGVRGVHFQPMSHFGRVPPELAGIERLTLPELMTGLEEQSQGQIRIEDFAPPGCEHSMCSFHAVYVRDGRTGLGRRSGSRTACCQAPRPAAEGADRSKAFTARQWSAPETGAGDGFALIRNRIFSISAMAFQDAWTLDLERLQGCCIHVVAPDGRLVPFCAWNLTSVRGQALYRGRQG
ncbi:MAG: radical SAM protein [Deltaproteobacteria bacterium]|nr:radical SAM protein [Deltaproteobacteria bacterium]